MYRFYLIALSYMKMNILLWSDNFLFSSATTFNTFQSPFQPPLYYYLLHTVTEIPFLRWYFFFSFFVSDFQLLFMKFILWNLSNGDIDFFIADNFVIKILLAFSNGMRNMNMQNI